MKFHKDGSRPKKTEIFVFGSNLAGINGAGAAFFAVGHCGAKMRVGKGLMGNSYALPTKDDDIKTLPLIEIKNYVLEFKQFTEKHPELEFFVTAIGTKLAGYSHSDIAPMFKGFPDNCSFPDVWKNYLL